MNVCHLQENKELKLRNFLTFKLLAPRNNCLKRSQIKE